MRIDGFARGIGTVLFDQSFIAMAAAAVVMWKSRRRTNPLLRRGQFGPNKKGK
jgi:uncharacterized iron-regulated membrane protein